MISHLQIANYKSIESLDIEARRVNVFIGEPNSGKSNLLEAVGLVSSRAIENLRDTFRIEQVADLFFDQDLTRTIRVDLQPLSRIEFHWDERQFEAIIIPHGQLSDRGVSYLISPNGRIVTPLGKRSAVGDTRLYRYRDPSHTEWNGAAVPELLTPFGDNLPSLLAVNKPLRDSVSTLFRSKGFRLEIRPSEQRILMTKEVDDVLYSFPFVSISETLRRIVFYKAVLETNKDAILVLDEPEANTFPFYTKYLAERIALDESNQFFLSTHNPYVLMSIIEKTPKIDLAVYVTRMRNFRTEVRRLSDAELDEALELSMDLFLNLDRYFPE